MQGLSFVLLAFIVALNVDCATIKRATENDPSSIHFYPLNSTIPSLGGEIDTRFSVIPHYTTQRLPATAILMNTVTLLAESADRDFDELIRFGEHAVFEDYPTVAIDLQTAKRGYKIANAFLVWALYRAAEDMILNSKFFAATFDIVWKGRVIARLMYSRAPEGNPINGSPVDNGLASNSKSMGSRISKNDERALTNATTMDGGNTDAAAFSGANSRYFGMGLSDEILLHLQYLSNAQKLSIWTVFMTVIAALKDDSAASTQPPYLLNDQLNNALRVIPGLMLKQGKLAEVAFSIAEGSKE